MNVVGAACVVWASTWCISMTKTSFCVFAFWTLTSVVYDRYSTNPKMSSKTTTMTMSPNQRWTRMMSCWSTYQCVSVIISMSYVLYVFIQTNTLRLRDLLFLDFFRLLAPAADLGLRVALAAAILDFSLSISSVLRSSVSGVRYVVSESLLVLSTSSKISLFGSTYK